MQSSGPHHCFLYEACDIPPGTTIQAWKREKAGATTARSAGRPGTLRRLLRRSR